MQKSGQIHIFQGLFIQDLFEQFPKSSTVQILTQLWNKQEFAGTARGASQGEAYQSTESQAAPSALQRQHKCAVKETQALRQPVRKSGKTLLKSLKMRLLLIRWPGAIQFFSIASCEEIYCYLQSVYMGEGQEEKQINRQEHMFLVHCTISKRDETHYKKCQYLPWQSPVCSGEEAGIYWTRDQALYKVKQLLRRLAFCHLVKSRKAALLAGADGGVGMCMCELKVVLLTRHGATSWSPWGHCLASFVLSEDLIQFTFLHHLHIKPGLTQATNPLSSGARDKGRGPADSSLGRFVYKKSTVQHRDTPELVAVARCRLGFPERRQAAAAPGEGGTSWAPAALGALRGCRAFTATAGNARLCSAAARQSQLTCPYLNGEELHLRIIAVAEGTPDANDILACLNQSLFILKHVSITTASEKVFSESKDSIRDG
ncbi:hypothetical protein EK904_003438 [Melospiza melodia maxima]|nr:hypothetical protein EK904_003438 [Melospiza melodia maxima]